MGITCKPIGKFRSDMRKLQNELDLQEKLEKENKVVKKQNKHTKSNEEQK
jgi:Sec-independent protein translocase protein TatA